ncbi:MAG: hypothetical protein MK052_03790 [Alphaproteobacteria bacterium]|nr:hypothetical protein [Alphaproteobacteria bacterium]
MATQAEQWIKALNQAATHPAELVAKFEKSPDFPANAGTETITGDNFSIVDKDGFQYSLSYSQEKGNNTPTYSQQNVQLNGEPYTVESQLAFDGGNMLTPQKVTSVISGENSETMDAGTRNLLVHTSKIIAGNEHLQNNLIAPAIMESTMLYPDEPVKTGTILMQAQDKNSELWSIGVGCDVTNGEASEPYAFITDGNDRYAQIQKEGRIVNTGNTQSATKKLETTDTQSQGVESLPPEMTAALGKASYILATANAARKQIISGQALEADNALQAYAEKGLGRFTEMLQQEAKDTKALGNDSPSI